MMCARLLQGKASLGPVHKITLLTPRLSHFYHSSSAPTSKLRSSSDTMSRFSPQQSRPVHATPFMNHSTTPSYVSPSHHPAPSRMVSHGLETTPETPERSPLILLLEMPTMTPPTRPISASTCAPTASLPLAPRATKPRRPVACLSSP